MPAKKRPAEELRKLKAKTFNGYTEKHLDDHDRKRINDTASTLDPIACLEKWSGFGWKTSIRWDWDSECWRVDLYRFYQGYDDSGYMFTGRHADMTKALAIVEYVVFELWDGRLPVGNSYDW